MSTPMTKCCTRCVTDKPLGAFAKKKTGRLGVAAWCKGCQKAWELENRDAIVARRKAHYQANAERLKSEARQRRVELRDYYALKSVEYYAKHSERLKAAARAAYRANPEPSRAAARRWHKEHRQYATERRKAWLAAQPGKARAYSAAREAAKLAATPSWANEFFINEAYSLAKKREEVCGGKWHVDHIVPLRSRLVCGLHVETNLQVIQGIENLTKGNRWWPDMPEGRK